MYELSPSGLISALEEKYEKSLTRSIACIDLNDFLILASHIFFQQVSYTK